MKKLISLLFFTVLLSGCSGADITSHLREPGTNTNMMTRCTQFESVTDGNMNNNLEDFDGWKMIYVSEYTTSNKMNTSMIMCFEKEKPAMPPHMNSVYR
ncbi:lipoprotein [Photobacterium sp. J15]|uniref:lipoprotein n=1 Tax=Photobacterium sp. J15 TaxID=265901 RepID=UPI0007E4715C|nr:lipoprotein [Photobacterium sp. J15]